MDYKFINEILKNEYKLDKIKKSDVNYKCYIEQIGELKERNITPFSFKEVLQMIKNSPYLTQVEGFLTDIDEDVINKSYGHGINHNIRVLLYATILSILLKTL